jgi:hypothetical protein
MAHNAALAGKIVAQGIPFVATPAGYSGWWLALAALLAALVVFWCVAAVVWTLPVAVLRKIPVLRDITRKVLRKRFAKAVDRIEQGYLSGQIPPREAHHSLARILRTYLHFQTGEWTQVMGLPDIAASGLRPAAGPLALIAYGQFSAESNTDLRGAVSTAREVIASWN